MYGLLLESTDPEDQFRILKMTAIKMAMKKKMRKGNGNITMKEMKKENGNITMKVMGMIRVHTKMLMNQIKLSNLRLWKTRM